MNKLVGLWKSGVKGKAVGIVCGAMVLLLLLQSGCGGSSDGGSRGNVRALFAKAKEAEKAGNINFFGFYTGMPMEDAKALAGTSNTDYVKLAWALYWYNQAANTYFG